MTKLRKSFATVGLLLAAAAMGLGGILWEQPAAASAQVTEIAPIAKYEFKDAANFGKDSMGNYDMSYGHAYQEGGTGPIQDKGTLIEGGGVEFNGEFCLVQDPANTIFTDVTAFTLAFEIKTTAYTDWQHYIGVASHFDTPDEPYLAIVGRAGNSGSAEASQAALNASGTGAGTYWDAAFLSDSSAWGKAENEFQKVIISAQPGGQLRVFINGTEFIKDGKLPATLAEDWSPYSKSCTFSIGAGNNGNAFSPAKGALKNVVFYDFAMDAACAAAYNTSGKVTPADVDGMTTITGLTVTDSSFADSKPTKVTLNAGMSTQQMLAQLNEAAAQVALSNESSTTAAVTWTNVVEEGGTYYAVGTADTTRLGYANTYGSEVRYALTVAEIKDISDPVFAEGAVVKSALDDTMTEDEMLALINTAQVTVTMGNDTQQTVTVTFTRIEAALGVYTAYADVVVEGATVGTVTVELEVTATNTGEKQELLPIAKYEFEDAENPGKDSMGNYDLGLVARDGGDTSNAYGTGTITDGVIYLSGDDVLACNTMNDVGDNVNNGFTLNFQYRQDGTYTDPGKQGWITPIGFGYNDWEPTKRLTFQIADGSTQLRVGAHGGVADDNGNTFWGPVVVNNGTDKMYNVTVTVRPGETFTVYVDGVQAYTTECPADWNLSDSNMAFSIGGVCVWGNGYNRFKGWIDNITIYNFAIGAEQVAAYWANGKLTVGDMDGKVITSIASTPKFENDEVTSSALSDNLTDTQATRRVNAATVDAVFADESAIALNVTWQRLEQDSDGKWYIVGTVDPSDIGYATLLTEAQTVRQEVTVNRVARTVEIANSTNGTVTADKQEAYLGETITFTVTPDEGYELAALTVNGTALAAGADGSYTYTVEGISNVEVAATFRAASSQGGGAEGTDGASGNGCAGGCNSSLALGAGIGGAAVVLTALVLVLAVRRRHE